MKCADCGTEMENGFRLQLGPGGVARIVKAGLLESDSALHVLVCPTCGKIALHADYQSIKK